MNKVGSEKYYIIISLILGIIVLSLSLYFIFYEYFSEDDVSWETCRQSVLLRSGNAINIVKEAQAKSFSFKCKTEVVEIDFKDYDKAGRLIMDTMAQCWSLFGEGKLQLYSGNFLGSDKNCFYCARIHFTEDVKDFYGHNPTTAEEKYKDLLKLSDPNRAEIEKFIIDNNISDWIGLKTRERIWQAKWEEIQKYELEGLVVDPEDRASVVRNRDKNKADLKLLEDFMHAKDKALEEYRKANPVKAPFNWRRYLKMEMGNTGKTYGQYLYRFPDKEAYLHEKPFVDEDWAPVSNIEYTDYFDPSRGDLFVNVVFSTGSLFGKGYYSILAAHQLDQAPVCTNVETIPA